LAGNGLQGTLIALRGAQEGFAPALIGFMGTAYFGGFLLGCLVITRMLRAVGHIRAFAGLAAMAAASTLMMVLVIEPITWAALRLIIGFCFAGLFTVMESWINSGVSNAARGRVLALYRIIDLGSVTFSQFLIPAFGSEGFTIFGVMVIMITLSMVPVALADRSQPKAPSEVSLDLKGVWLLSPVACAGCITSGLTNSAFRMVGPVYAQGIGLSVPDIAVFMSAGIVGGIILQYPLGALSDRWDRRIVLLTTTAGAMLTGLGIAFIAGDDRILNFVFVLAYAAFALPLFSLAAAHANDHAGSGDFVKIAAALMLFYSIGAVAGPLLASSLMERFGLPALFLYSAAVYAVFIVLTVYRMNVRGPAPAAQRGRFIALLRTSPLFARLARRSGKQH
jgi:MFS family permease